MTYALGHRTSSYASLGSTVSTAYSHGAYHSEGDAESAKEPLEKPQARKTRFRQRFTPWASLQGWRMGIFSAACGLITVILINFIAMIYAVATFGSKDGLGTIYEGDCDKTNTMSTWIHLAINVLSTLILSGSNYAQQCLTSPTRDEVNEAHAKKVWLDIGIPSSLRNLRRIATPRLVLASIIMASSIPVHLLYNSAVFSSIAANEYNVVVVHSNAFDTDAPRFTNYSSFSLSTRDYGFDQVYDAKMNTTVDAAANWRSLTPKECVDTYGQNFVRDVRSLVLVLDQANTTNTIRWMFTTEISQTEQQQVWICNIQHKGVMSLESERESGVDLYDVCDVDAVINSIHDGGKFMVEGQSVKECRVEDMPDEHCKLQFSVTILSIVIVCNLLKVCCMVYILLRHHFSPLVTVGDAIESFLSNPEPWTKNLCFASQNDIHGIWKKTKVANKGEFEALQAGSASGRTLESSAMYSKRRWWRSASRGRWLACLGGASASLIMTASLLGVGLKNDNAKFASNTISAMWKRGIGKVNPISLCGLTGGGLLSAATISNLPQILLSTLYFMYNSLFTSMLLGVEWNNFSLRRKRLRVTKPRGKQNSTYWLQLPYRFAIPLMILSGVLHWLTSQALFLAYIEVQGNGCDSTPSYYSSSYTYDHVFDNFSCEFNAEDPEIVNYIQTTGYSSFAMIIILPTGALALLAAVITGMRKYSGVMPVASSNSASIAAACHEEAVDTEASIQWGVVKQNEVWGKENVGHLSFSDRQVEAPEPGALYAGIKTRRRSEATSRDAES